MRAVYPENFHPIGSVQKKWQAFFSFHEENFGVDLATKKQHLCTIYPAHFLSDFRKSTLLCYSIKVFWVKPSGEPQVANMWLKIEFNIATFYQHIREKLDSCMSDTFPPYMPHPICATPYMCHTAHMPCCHVPCCTCVTLHV